MTSNSAFEYPEVQWTFEDSTLVDPYFRTVGKQRIYHLSPHEVDVTLPEVDRDATDGGFDLDTRRFEGYTQTKTKQPLIGILYQRVDTVR